MIAEPVIGSRVGECQKHGEIFVLEHGKELPFLAPRLYFFDELPEWAQRGNHAHRTSLQVHICLRGKVEIKLDNGTFKRTAVLRKGQTLIIPPFVWHTVKLGKGAVVLVAANDLYNEGDYVRDYNKFLRFVDGRLLD